MSEQRWNELIEEFISIFHLSFFEKVFFKFCRWLVRIYE